MKHITLVFLQLLAAVTILPAQTALRRINRNVWRSEFLQAVSVHPLDYGETVFTPVYSWLEEKVPSAKWVSYGGAEFRQCHQVSVADGCESIDADDVRFAAVAYTKGNFALVMCCVTSFADIDEHRLYTYDPDGKVIDSLVFYREFTAESGQFLLPLAGALMGNLDVVICEVVWLGELLPYHPMSHNLIGGKQRGQRVDSYYSLDTEGHFILRKQERYPPRTYTDDDITTLDLRDKNQHERKPVFRINSQDAL